MKHIIILIGLLSLSLTLKSQWNLKTNVKEPVAICPASDSISLKSKLIPYLKLEKPDSQISLYLVNPIRTKYVDEDIECCSEVEFIFIDSNKTTEFKGKEIYFDETSNEIVIMDNILDQDHSVSIFLLLLKVSDQLKIKIKNPYFSEHWYQFDMRGSNQAITTLSSWK